MRFAVFAFALASCATTPAAVATAPEAANSEPVPFGEGMTRPKFDVSALAEGVYGPGDIAAGVRGMLIIKCHVMASGEVRNCRQIKPLPRVGERMLARLEGTRMEPCRRDGTPLSVDYVFNFAFKPPGG